MKQLGLSIPLFIKRPKVTRRQKFLEEMEQVIPWAEWTNQIAPHYPVAEKPKGPDSIDFPGSSAMFLDFIVILSRGSITRFPQKNEVYRV